ncbi:hypothetical protein ZWY2020_027625 [Hordeum vulgare]|nr:hypothetical protein ZWY2020_027625 [Hordeum vulgare]
MNDGMDTAPEALLSGGITAEACDRDRGMAAPAAEVEMGGGEGLPEGDAGGGGARRRRPLGWRCMPFIIGTYVRMCSALHKLDSTG